MVAFGFLQSTAAMALPVQTPLEATRVPESRLRLFAGVPPSPPLEKEISPDNQGDDSQPDPEDGHGQANLQLGHAAKNDSLPRMGTIDPGGAKRRLPRHFISG